MRRTLAIGFLVGTLILGPLCATKAQEAATPAGDSASPPALVEFVREIPLDERVSDARSAASGLAVANDGTLYVVVPRHDHIQVFDRDGDPLTTWGEHGSGPGQFSFRGMGFLYGDLAIGPDGNVYVMDTANSRIQVFSPSGDFLRAWGEQGVEPGQFSVPSGIDVDDAGRVYVTETGNRRLQIFDQHGQVLSIWQPSEAEGGPFRDPADVAVDAAGAVWVTDFDANRIYHFDAKGKVTAVLGMEREYRSGEAEQLGVLTNPWGAAVDAQGNLYVAEYGGRRVQVFAPDGTPLGAITGETSSRESPAMTPIYLAIGSDGALFLAEYEGRQVQVFHLLPPLVSAPGTP